MCAADVAGHLWSSAASARLRQMKRVACQESGRGEVWRQGSAVNINKNKNETCQHRNNLISLLNGGCRKMKKMLGHILKTILRGGGSRPEVIIFYIYFFM